MIKLPLRELEEALRNPSEYRKKLSRNADSGFGYSYLSVLRNAIFKYHRPGTTPSQTHEYLDDRLSKFKNPRRADEIMGQYEWYLEHHANFGLATFKTRLVVQVPITSRSASDVVCSGQLDRLDIRLTSGYAAWLFRSRDHLNWSGELRMPLTQLAVAHTLGVETDEVTIGIYSFQERFVDDRKYSQEEIASACAKLDQLLTELGI